jgi:hypothetical protein
MQVILNSLTLGSEVSVSFFSCNGDRRKQTDAVEKSLTGTVCKIPTLAKTTGQTVCTLEVDGKGFRSFPLHTVFSLTVNGKVIL